MVVEMSTISHRSTKTSVKVDKTIARWSATFKRLPKTTEILMSQVVAKRSYPQWDWAIIKTNI